MHTEDLTEWFSGLKLKLPTICFTFISWPPSLHYPMHTWHNRCLTDPYRIPKTQCNISNLPISQIGKHNISHIDKHKTSHIGDFNIYHKFQPISYRMSRNLTHHKSTFCTFTSTSFTVISYRIRCEICAWTAV